MAKKVFYNRRYKMPGWLQPYVLWVVLALVTCAIVFFTSVERVGDDRPPALPATVNGFAEGLFLALREAEPGDKYAVALRYAERLKKKHGYAVREKQAAECRVLQLSRGAASPWFVSAALQNEQHGGVFAVMVFLDRLAAGNGKASVNAELLFPRKNCAIGDALRLLQTDKAFPVFVDAGNNAPAYDRIPRLRNLNLRRHFPAAFLLPERTLWVNILSLTAEGAMPDLFTVPAPRAADSLSDQLSANPLLSHPAVMQSDATHLTAPVALYLGAYTQLHGGGFAVLAVLIWILAFVPLANALGTFSERFDLASALTSAVLYAVAFASYLLLCRLILQFSRSDFSGIVFAILLLPAVFFPLRMLQKTVLRAELNRPGLHVLVQAVLSVQVFYSPLSALVGLLQLAAVSGYFRASLPRKLLRTLAAITPLALLAVAGRAPMGGVANFLAAYVPAFSVTSLPHLLALCVVGGNLTALLFVPRERV